MKHAIHEKFSQNRHLKEVLMNTGNKTLSEANKWDTFWGSGVSLADSDIFTKPKHGKNTLGRLLVSLRDELK